MMELLDADRIRQSLDSEVLSRLESLMVLKSIESTNTYLLKQPAVTPGLTSALLAESQTAGRGQYGRRWVSPASSGICLSLAYSFIGNREEMPALTMAIGVSIVERLKSQLGLNALLKWPNDIFCNGAKLGGILVESKLRSQEFLSVVVGIGINVDLSRENAVMEKALKSAEATDLQSCIGHTVCRDSLAAWLIEAVCRAFWQFDLEGFEPFIRRWNALDWLHGKNVLVDVSNDSLKGEAIGISESGALRIETNKGVESIVSGSVRVCDQFGNVA